MKLHVLTACSRPRNLNRLAVSLRAWGPDADFTWHIRFDEAGRHVGGQAVKNAMLDSISDGWVWFLDDDTLAHPDLYRRVAEIVHTGITSAVVVSQHRTDNTVLEADRNSVYVGGIDIGQAIIERLLIGDERIPEEYAGDGYFLERVLDEDTVFVADVLSWHNRLEKVRR